MLRRVLCILVIILLACGIAGLALRKYLTSRTVADNVVAQLQTVYKGDIKLGGVDVGLGSTSLTKLELFETGSTEKTPWLEIQDLHIDVSLLDYFQGNSLPGRMKISGAKVLLRFSRDGTLLTTLPEPLSPSIFENAEEPGRFDSVPMIDFEKSEVTLRTEGAPDLVIRDFSGKLDKSVDQMSFTGAAENGTWGKWSIVGLLQKQSAKFSVQFKSQGTIHVTGAMLEQLPFVPETCWCEVRIGQMDTSALVHLDFDLKQCDIHCRAEFDAGKAEFQVESLPLQVSHARARIVFEDNQILLRDFQGEVFGGLVRGGADLTFDAGLLSIDSRVEASRCEVSQFPPSWGLPADVSGKLNGVASLKVVIIPSALSAEMAAGLAALVGDPLGPVEFAAALLAVPFQRTIHTEGAGKGLIVDAVSGQLRVSAIHLDLHAVPGGFRFGSTDK
jgi:hypothetical protein